MTAFKTENMISSNITEHTKPVHGYFMSTAFCLGCVLATVLFAQLLWTWTKDRPKPLFKLVGEGLGNAARRRKAYNTDARKIYMEGYRKFQNSPYRITTFDGEHIVVPTSALEELRLHPDETVNNTDSLEGNYEPRYTGKIPDIDFLIHIIRSDLTHNLNRINPRLGQVVNETVRSELGACGGWTPIVVYKGLLRIVAIASGSIFLGPELCRLEEWLHCSINFTTDMARGVGKLKQWHAWLRPVAARFFIPEIRPIWEHRAKANEILLPVIRERKEKMANGESVPDDLLQWMINKAHQHDLADEDLAQLQLTLSMASIHTTTISLADIICELAIRPELLVELRKEITHVLQRSGEEASISSADDLFRMKLLDSVMRESQRMNPVAQQRFVRTVRRPIRLSDGTLIPTGSTIEASHGTMMQDPRLYPHPEQFDPYRFYNLRTTDAPDPIGYKTREQYQFVSVPKENMGFGFGRHACPGRFFASNEMKAILAFIILNYDIRMPNGSLTRHEGITLGTTTYPNPGNIVEIKRVSGGQVMSG